jgi:hypothetical protein
MVSLKSFKDNVLLARQFSISDWLALVEAWWLLYFFYLALRWMSYERLLSSTRPMLENSPEPSPMLIFAHQLQRLVGFAARLHLIPMTCLIKSLSLQKMLSKRNIPAQIKIGAQKIQGTIYAHAWVEVNRKPIGEADDIAQKFNVLESAVELNSRQFI